MTYLWGCGRSLLHVSHCVHVSHPVHVSHCVHVSQVTMQQFDSHKEKSAVDELAETGHEFRDLWRFDLDTGAWDSLKVRVSTV